LRKKVLKVLNFTLFGEILNKAIDASKKSIAMD
jgi:hypothetical protein